MYVVCEAAEELSCMSAGCSLLAKHRDILSCLTITAREGATLALSLTRSRSLSLSLSLSLAPYHTSSDLLPPSRLCLCLPPSYILRSRFSYLPLSSVYLSHTHRSSDPQVIVAELSGGAVVHYDFCLKCVCVDFYLLDYLNGTVTARACCIDQPPPPPPVTCHCCGSIACY